MGTSQNDLDMSCIIRSLDTYMYTYIVRVDHNTLPWDWAAGGTRGSTKIEHTRREAVASKNLETQFPKKKPVHRGDKT